MERSRKLVLTNWTLANDALNQFFVGNKSDLAKRLKMSRTTITAFFKLEPVREAEFRKICSGLRLNWQEVSGVKAIAPPSQTGEADQAIALPNEDNRIDALIPQVREHCRQKILNQHSRMRLLSGDEIGVDQLYVDVWVLNRSPRTYQVSPSKLLETFDLRNDRLGLGDRIQRIEGFEFANKNPKLVILGKPGSGKTTFLKHLAVDWCSDRFQPDLIAVLIEFRRIRAEQWQLLNAIGEELGLDEGYQIRALKEQIKQLQRSTSKSLEEKQQQKKQIESLQQQLNALPLQVLLTQGKLLILMDGLDEVPASNLRRNVQDQLHEIVEDYPKNRFTLTCRTQVITSPVGFASVEVAEFSPRQVQQFVQNWFKANGKPETIAT
jgi:predicted NACHT family NTPase